MCLESWERLCFFSWLVGQVSSFNDLLCVKSMEPILYRSTTEAKSANSRRESTSEDRGAAAELFKTIRGVITTLRRLPFLSLSRWKTVYPIRLLPILVAPPSLPIVERSVIFSHSPLTFTFPPLSALRRLFVFLGSFRVLPQTRYKIAKEGKERRALLQWKGQRDTKTCAFQFSTSHSYKASRIKLNLVVDNSAPNSMV